MAALPPDRSTHTPGRASDNHISAMERAIRAKFIGPRWADVLETGKLAPFEERPATLVRAQATFPDLDHKIRIDVLGALIDDEFEGLRVLPFKEVKARIAIYQDDCEGSLCTQMLLLVDGTTIDVAPPAEEQCMPSSYRAVRPRCRFDVSDTVTITIKELTRSGHGVKFSGKVVQASPFANPSDITMLVHSPKQTVQPYEHEKIDISSIFESCVRIDKDLITSKSTCEALKKAETVVIDITPTKDAASARRIRAAGKLLHDRWEQRIDDLEPERQMREQDWNSLWTGTNQSSVTRRDIYAGISSEILDRCRSGFGDRVDQQQCFDYVRQLPNGFGLITGPPGTGKTHCLVQLMQPFFEHYSENSGSPKQQLLAVSSVDLSVDAMAVKIQNMLQATLKDTEPLVIRPHCRQMEAALFKQPIRHNRYQEAGPPFRGSLHGGRFNDLGVELADLQYVHELWKYLNDINTPETGFDVQQITQKIVELEMSLSFKILQFCGITPPRDTPKRPELRPLQELQEYYRYALENEPQLKDKAKIRDLIRWTASWLLREADAVCITAAFVMDELIQGAIRPTAVIADEATRIPNLFFNALDSINPERTVFLAAGDGREPLKKPSTPADYNHFGAQLAFPEFMRMISLHYPRMVMVEQHRFGPHACNILSPICYDGRMTASPHWNAGTTQQVKAQQKIMSIFRVVSTFFELRVEGTREEIVEPTKSRKNDLSAVAVWKLVSDLVAVSRGVYKPSDIMVLTPFVAQANNLLRLQQTLASGGIYGDALGKEDIMATTVSTIEKMQGSERPIVILDSTCTSEPGILAEPARFSTAASRAQHVFILLIEHEAIMQSYQQRKSDMFGRLLNWFDEHGDHVSWWPATQRLANEPLYTQHCNQRLSGQGSPTH